MRVLLQRVTQANVAVDSQIIAEIDSGLTLLTGIHKNDTEKNVSAMAKKIANLRIFSDEKGRFHYSVLEKNLALLVVPQFTLFADMSKGRRPEFFDAMPPKEASQLCLDFSEQLKQQGISQVEYGQFGAHMMVSLVNDGPVTVMVEV